MRVGATLVRGLYEFIILIFKAKIERGEISFDFKLTREEQQLIR